jgi:hypothetical protein
MYVNGSASRPSRSVPRDYILCVPVDLRGGPDSVKRESRDLAGNRICVHRSPSPKPCYLEAEPTLRCLLGEETKDGRKMSPEVSWGQHMRSDKELKRRYFISAVWWVNSAFTIEHMNQFPHSPWGMRAQGETLWTGKLKLLYFLI